MQRIFKRYEDVTHHIQVSFQTANCRPTRSTFQFHLSADPPLGWLYMPTNWQCHAHASVAMIAATRPAPAKRTRTRRDTLVRLFAAVLFSFIAFISLTSTCPAFHRNQHAAMLPPAAADPRRGSGQRPSSRTTTAFRFFHRTTATVIAIATIATDCHNHHVRIHQPYSLWRRRKM